MNNRKEAGTIPAEKNVFFFRRIGVVMVLPAQFIRTVPPSAGNSSATGW
jgi:hypothetical protein